jgi:hypothetical protein
MSLISKGDVLKHVTLSPQIELILEGLETVGAASDLGGGVSTGTVKLTTDLSKSPIPGFDFALAVPPIAPPAPYKLKLDATSFQFWLVLADAGKAAFVFKFIKGLPGLVLTGAEQVAEADGILLRPFPPGNPLSTPVLVSRGSEQGDQLGPALLISGVAGQPGQMRFTPDTDSAKGIVTFGLEPPTMMFGSSKIGFHCPKIILDDSDEAKGDGNGAPKLVPELATIAADDPA